MTTTVLTPNGNRTSATSFTVIKSPKITSFTPTTGALPVVVELGILLDLLVAVFVMGIAIHHISREFDHIDTRALASLRD